MLRVNPLIGFGNNGGGSIVSGALFNLDAASSSSYPGSGTTWGDLSGNARAFSLVNGPSNGGLSVSGVSFDGVNDHATIAHGTWFPQGSSPKTLECYAYMRAWRAGQSAFLMTKATTSNVVCTLGFSERGGVVSLMTGGDGATGELSYNLPSPGSFLNSWHHYAYTYDGSTVRLYLDGVNVATSAGGFSYGANSAPIYVMALDPNNPSFVWPVNGILSFITMYSFALTPAQILSNYLARKR